MFPSVPEPHWVTQISSWSDADYVTVCRQAVQVHSEHLPVSEQTTFQAWVTLYSEMQRADEAGASQAQDKELREKEEPEVTSIML